MEKKKRLAKKMNEKPMVLVSSIIMLMTISGLAYAQWSNILYINGTVNTGELRIEFTKVSGGGGGDIVKIIDKTKVEWMITNAYPGWSGALHCEMKNLESIPLKFKEAKLIVTSDPKGLMAYMKSRLQISYDREGKAPFDVSSHRIQPKWEPLDKLDDEMNKDTTLLAMVLESGGWLKFSIHSKIDETAPNHVENATLTFVLEITFQQWNQRGDGEVEGD